MQQIAAGWLMVQMGASPAQIAFLTTAAALPVLLLVLPAGALADVLDRRKLIIGTQIWQLLVSATLGVLTLTGHITPTLLLIGVAAYGLGATLGMPPQSAVLPEIVSHKNLPQAVSLNSTGFTAAQAIGPAAGGILVASVGAGWAFIANAASFIGVVLVFITWRREAAKNSLPAEHIGSAIRTGVRYISYSSQFQIVLLRLWLHMFCFAAFPALLVVVIKSRLGGSAGDFGLALGVFGIGGIIGALVLLPRLRGRVSADVISISGATIFATTGLAWAGFATSFPLLLAGLAVAGAASMLAMSTLQTAAQQVLPDWVRGRGLAMVQLIFQTGMAGGGALWGAIATSNGISTSMLMAGITLVTVTLLATIFGARLNPIGSLNLEPANAWAGAGSEPIPGSAPDEGPVLAIVEYDVKSEKTDEFLAVMRSIGRTRKRNGAIHWSLSADVQIDGRYVECYSLTSFVEQQRESERMTVDDLDTFKQLCQLTVKRPDPPRLLLSHQAKLRANLGNHPKNGTRNPQSALPKRKLEHNSYEPRPATRFG